MRVPLTWLRSYCDPGLSAEEIAERLDLTGTELERIERVGVPSADGFVVGKVLKAEKHPDADRLTVCEVDDGSGTPRTIVCGAPNVAAGQTVAVALPGATMPDGTKLGEAELRGVKSQRDDPGRGRGRPGRPARGDHGAARRPGRRARRWPTPADRRRGAGAGDHARTGPTACASTASRARCTPPPGAELAEDPAAADATAEGSDSAEDHATVEIADPDICLRFTARVFEDVKIGPVARVAQAAADRRRPAADLQRRRHHQLRDARHRPAAARVRPRRGARQPDRGPQGQAGGEDGHARRRRARVRPRDGAGVRRRGPVGHRRRDGRPDLRGLGQDHARADGGGDLGRPQHPADVEGAGPALARRRPGSRSSFTPTTRWPRSGWRPG